MKNEIIYSNITELTTPVGSFRVSSDSGEVLPFSVVRNPWDHPTEVCDENGNVIGQIETKTDYQILIDADSLEIGKTYKIIFSSGQWQFCDADEHTVCFHSIIGKYAVGIGAYDPNDEEKFDQMCKLGLCREPDEYDESKFTGYTVYSTETLNGFSFKKFDDSIEKITFLAVWISMDGYSPTEYENALGLWLC